MTTLLVIGSVWFAVAFVFVMCLGLAARRAPIMETADCPADGEAMAAVELVSRLTALQEAATAQEAKSVSTETNPTYASVSLQSTAKAV